MKQPSKENAVSSSTKKLDETPNLFDLLKVDESNAATSNEDDWAAFQCKSVGFTDYSALRLRSLLPRVHI